MDSLINASWILPLAALLMGAVVGVAIWFALGLLPDPPEEDREFRDPPPLGFRMLWWPVQWMEPRFDRLLSRQTRLAFVLKLRQAGLEFSLSPGQFYAGQLAFMITSVVLMALLLAVLTGLGTADATKGEFEVGYGNSLLLIVMVAALGWFLPLVWLRDRIKARQREFVRALPFFLDVITLCVEAGLNLQGAITQAVAKGPRGYLRDEFQRVLRDIRAGKSRAEALRDMSDRVKDQSLSHFTSCVIQAERMGMSLGPMLRTQGEQRLNERFMRAEKLALEAPVKMLFPLIACIFPCTFIVLLFPIVSRLLAAGG